jgi:hypothetical protein
MTFLLILTQFQLALPIQPLMENALRMLTLSANGNMVMVLISQYQKALMTVRLLGERRKVLLTR